MAHVAAADGFGKRCWTTIPAGGRRRARGPLAEPAGLCPAARLRTGRRRLAGVGNVADRARQIGAQRRRRPQRVVDSLAADRRRTCRPANSGRSPIRCWPPCARCTAGRRRGKGSGDVGFTPQQSVEMWRLLAGLELLPVGDKTELGDMLVELMSKKSMQPARGAMIWALGRIGTRQPLYGPLNTVVPAEAAKALAGQAHQDSSARRPGNVLGHADRTPHGRPLPGFG